MSVARQARRLPPGSSSPAILSRLAAVRAPSTTLAPSRSAAAATSRPSPAPTPDTPMVFPSTSMRSPSSPRRSAPAPVSNAPSDFRQPVAAGASGPGRVGAGTAAGRLRPHQLEHVLDGGRPVVDDLAVAQRHAPVDPLDVQ